MFTISTKQMLRFLMDFLLNISYIGIFSPGTCNPFNLPVLQNTVLQRLHKIFDFCLGIRKQPSSSFILWYHQGHSFFHCVFLSCKCSYIEEYTQQCFVMGKCLGLALGYYCSNFGHLHLLLITMQ